MPRPKKLGSPLPTDIEAEIRKRASMGQSASDIQAWLADVHNIKLARKAVQWRLEAAAQFFGEAARSTAREVLLPSLLEHLSKMNEIAEEARERRLNALSDLIWVKLVAEEVKVRDKLIQYMGIAEKQKEEAFSQDLSGRSPQELSQMLAIAQRDIEKMQTNLASQGAGEVH